MELIISAYKIVSTILSIFAIICLVYAAVLWARGILPAVIRLGNGLAKRKIAIFAKEGQYTSLKSLLIDSKLFSEKNVFAIIQEGDIGKAEQATIFLVHWKDWENSYKKILGVKPDGCALIVYAKPRAIPPEDMEELEKYRNTVVTNFRGRLLSDIVAAMITTGYKMK